MKKAVRLYLTGFAMGSADIVPGVSGGTVALLLGVYERLIESIKIITGKVVKLVLRGKIKEAWAAAPLNFLVPLGLGLGTALFLMSSILSNLLTNYPVYTWSAFFGLVLASAVVVREKIKKWQFGLWPWLLGAVFLTYVVVGMIPVETPANPVAFFLSGMVAICAMILPGISGSFILLMLGKYHQVLEAVVELNILTLAMVAAGAVIGLALFSRLLSYLFKHYHDRLIAVLTGMLLGSLRKIWPWKETVLTRLNSHGELVPVVERNVLAPNFAQLAAALALMAAAFALVWWLGRAQAKAEE